MYQELSHYQRFNPEHKHTASDSFSKLEQVKFPLDFSGKRYLDIGCNTGFFCFAAEERGASESVGIDVNKDFVELGTKISEELGLKRTRLLNLSWDDLDKVEGKFDVVSLMSALHYRERNMHSLMENVYRKIGLGGLFILEAGISPLRPDDVLVETLVRKVDQEGGSKTYYPNEKCVYDMLSQFDDVRKVGRSQDLDERPRYVFHAVRSLPTLNSPDIVENTFKKHPELKAMFKTVLGIADIEINSLSFHVSSRSADLANGQWVSFDRHPVYQFVYDPNPWTMGRLAEYFEAVNTNRTTANSLLSSVRDTVERLESFTRSYDPVLHGSLPVVHVDGRRVIDGTNRLLMLLFSGTKKAKVIFVGG